MHDVFGNTFSDVYAPKPRHLIEIEDYAPLSFLDRDITLEMVAIFLSWPQKWRIHWHDIFGSTFCSKIYAPQNLDVE